MTIQSLPSTTNFNLKYDDSNAQAQGMAQAIANICEGEFAALTGWFGITTGFGTSDRITMTVQSISSGGANNFGYQSGGNSQINVNFLPGGYTQSQANQIAPMMFVNEIVEIFMDFNNQKTGTTTWVAGHSDGEGLSQFCGILRFPAGHYLAYQSWANAWLSTGRADWVTSNESTDGDSVSFGCSLLFLFYLNTQLGFTPAQIIQAGAATPAQTYKNLTGDSSDPFGFFLSLINTALPGTSTITGASGQALDDPFPIFTLQFWDNKNTFGKAEVVDAVARVRPFTEAFVLDLEGFSPTQWQALGSPVPSDPSGPAAHFPGISFNRTSVEFENAALPKAPQRIHFNYDVGFGSTSAAGFTTAPKTLELDSSITVSGKRQPALTELTFYGAEDPYFASVGPSDNVPWLSQDLRVFATAAGGRPVTGGPVFSTDTIAGARGYLAALLPWLTQNYGDPSLTDPFDPAANVVPEQTGALTGDSSVLPNLNFLGINENIYNFAIARVRLNGSVGTKTTNPVKVFFRMWQSQSPDTDYQPGSTYNSHDDSVGQPDWPLPDSDDSTFPFFASSNTPNFTDPNNAEFGSNGVNSQVVTINHSAGQWTYFGCLLNVYDSGYLINGTPVNQLLPGTHHCLVAQIAYDDAPIVIPPGQSVSPLGGTDKLAQRNLQISQAFNPGKPPTNFVPQTFDIRPSRVSGSSSPVDFDELMIDWGKTPPGAVASIYWPGADANQVIKLADGRYGYHQLSAANAYTIQTPVIAGVTYVPIPPQSGANLASLLTVEMPPNVKAGQRYTIVVRRVTTYVQPQRPPIGTPALASPDVVPPSDRPAEVPAAAVVVRRPSIWRYITGAFQVDIAVQTDKEILPYDENTLAIFKWRLSVMPVTNRWYPVLKQYIAYLSDRIDGLGGNSEGIQPSPTGRPFPEPTHRPEPTETFEGKVVEVVYECFGDFEGFVLEMCDGRRTFRSRERGIEKVVRRALRDRDLLEVRVNEKTSRIEGIILRI